MVKVSITMNVALKEVEDHRNTRKKGKESRAKFPSYWIIFFAFCNSELSLLTS